MPKANVKKLGYIGKTPGTETRDSDSWYTPSKYVESARQVLGEFLLDPFTSVSANQVINAKNIFTEEDNALDKSWECARNGSVWMNPPYGRTMTAAVEKFVSEYSLGNFSQGIVLCNNATDTKWFARLMTKSTAICFTNHRIQFENIDGKHISGNTRGQCFIYFGNNQEKFKQEFSKWGVVFLQHP